MPGMSPQKSVKLVTVLPRDAMQARPMLSCGVCLPLSVCVCVRHVREFCQNE